MHGEVRNLTKPTEKQVENVRKRYTLRMKTPQDVTNILRRMANSVLNGEVDRSDASTVAYICQTALKSMELGDLANRLERIEKLMDGSE